EDRLDRPEAIAMDFMLPEQLRIDAELGGQAGWLGPVQQRRIARQSLLIVRLDQGLHAHSAGSSKTLLARFARRLRPAVVALSSTANGSTHPTLRAGPALYSLSLPEPRLRRVSALTGDDHLAGSVRRGGDQKISLSEF